MRVHVDDAGRHDHAVGVDRLARVVVVETRERSDRAVDHADVDAPTWEPGAVDDEAAAHDEVVHHESCTANEASP